jgi:hypothetical protein
MANTNRPHPKPERLAAYRGERLTGAEAEAVRQHLDGCPACRTLLASLPAKSPTTPGETPSDPGKTSSKTSPGRRKKKKKPKGVPLWVWITAGAGVVALVAGVVITVVLLNREPEPARPKTQVASKPAPLPVKSGPGNSPVPASQPGASPDKGPPPAQVPQPQIQKLPTGPLDVRVAMFGPARYKNKAFAGRTLAGVVVEVEGKAPGATGRFEAGSVTARAADKNIPAAVVFTAGDREGLADTAQLLANSTAEGGDIFLGTSRFTLWPVGGPGGPAPLTASIQQATTGRVHVPSGVKNFSIGDYLLAMPLVLERGGGVEFGFVPAKTVRLGFLFPARAADLTQIRLLGLDLPLEASKRLGEPVVVQVPAPGPQVPPVFPPGVAGNPSPPKREGTLGPNERAGWWAVPAAGGEPHLIVANRGHLATAVTRDLKRIAVFGSPTDEELASAKGKAATGLRVAVGEPGKPLRTIWKVPEGPSGRENFARLQWSPGGQRLLLAGLGDLLVVDLKGKGRYLTKGSTPATLFHGSGSAFWAGKGDSDLAVLGQGFTPSLLIVNALTGQSRDQIPLPRGKISGLGQHVDTSDDLATVAVSISPVGLKDEEGGLWVGRRAKRDFAQLVGGYIDRFTLSPGGKYLAVTTNKIKGNVRTTSLYEVASRRLIWSVTHLSAADFAFDRAGKQLAIATHNNQLLMTGLEAYQPTELVRGGSLEVHEPIWSADGREILFRLSKN